MNTLDGDKLLVDLTVLYKDAGVALSKSVKEGSYSRVSDMGIIRHTLNECIEAVKSGDYNIEAGL